MILSLCTIELLPYELRRSEVWRQPVVLTRDLAGRLQILYE